MSWPQRAPWNGNQKIQIQYQVYTIISTKISSYELNPETLLPFCQFRTRATHYKCKPMPLSKFTGFQQDGHHQHQLACNSNWTRLRQDVLQRSCKEQSRYSEWTRNIISKAHMQLRLWKPYGYAIRAGIPHVGTGVAIFICCTSSCRSGIVLYQLN